MDFTIILKILGWLKPGKYLTMFSKWWLKREDREFELKQLIENRKKPTWCQLCDISMEISGTRSRTTNSGTKHRAVFKCPKCGLIR